MCTYNGGGFLGQQLQSIASQKRLPDELVVCDDHSSDGSDALVGDFARKAPFSVRLIRNPQNLGSTTSFANVISSCGGNIIVLADQDDFWYPHKLERIAESFVVAPGPVAVFSDAELIDGSSRRLGIHLWQSFYFTAREQTRFTEGQALSVLLKHPVVTGATMAFQKRFLDLLLPIPSNHVHDSWIAFLLAACGPFWPIADPLMQYRRHSAQQVGPGDVTLRARVARAQSTRGDFYLEESQRFRQLYDRLAQRGAGLPGTADALREIEAKISHREHRARLPHSRFDRVPHILREAVNGGYWRYSEGWESIAKDLFLYEHKN
jgi:glycosyltransferase involved in cell wall biosynthesis